MQFLNNAVTFFISVIGSVFAGVVAWRIFNNFLHDDEARQTKAIVWAIISGILIFGATQFVGQIEDVSQTKIFGGN